MTCRLDRRHPAAIAGGYSGWTTPYSYNPVRQMQVDLGVLNNGTCLRSGQIEELTHCEAGSIKLPRQELKNRCLALNLTCPAVSFWSTSLSLRFTSKHTLLHHTFVHSWNMITTIIDISIAYSTTMLGSIFLWLVKGRYPGGFRGIG